MIEIKLFGTTVVDDGTTQVAGTALGGVKPRQLLEMLATELGNPLSKDLLAERLWEGKPPATYIATIESYVCVLRQHARLGRGRTAALATTTSGYLLDPEQVSVDLVQVRELCAQGGVAPALQALDLVSGDLLAANPYASWARQERESFDELLAGACVRAAAESNVRRDPATALRLARTAVGRSYLSEPAVRELMISLEGTDERWQAMRVYDQLRKDMIEDLGVEPGPETTQLYMGMLRRNSATTESRPEEIGTLLRLIRGALELDGGSRRHYPEMAEVAGLMMARCS